MTYAPVICMHMIIMNITFTCRYWYLTPHEHYMILPALDISVTSITTIIIALVPLQLLYSGKFSHGADFRIFRMKASVCGGKKCEIYANASTRTYVSTRGLN